MNRNNLIKTWIREIKGMIWKMILKRDDTILTIRNDILILKVHFLICMKHFLFLIDRSIHSTIRILKVKIKMHNIVRNLYNNLEKRNRSSLKEKRYIWSKGLSKNMESKSFPRNRVLEIPLFPQRPTLWFCFKNAGFGLKNEGFHYNIRRP